MSTLVDILSKVRYSMFSIVSRTQECMKSNDLIRTSNIRDRRSTNRDITNLINYDEAINDDIRSIITSLSEYTANKMVRTLLTDLQLQCDDSITAQCYTIGKLMYDDNLDVKSNVEYINKRMTYIIEYYTLRMNDVKIIIRSLTI